MVILDANMILRYLLNDNVEMSAVAEQYLEAGDVFVPIEVFAEVIYVLKGVYSLSRDTIVDILTDFLGLVNCSEMDVFTVALNTYGERNLDFVDCVLYGYHAVKGIKIATFDKKLIKLMNQ